MPVDGYLGVFVVAAVASFLLTIPVRRIAIRFGAVDRPDDRHVHARPTPTLGGSAMFLGFLIAVAAATQMDRFDPLFQGSTELLGVVLAASVIYAIGLLDDLRDVSAPAKMAGQVLAGSILSLLGVAMIFFRIPFFDFVALSPDLQPLITVLWVVGMCNAVNFIDGLDGLAGGIVAIAAGAFFVYSTHLVDIGLLTEDNAAPLIAVIALGVTIGFLPHNVHPARIFMGDCGALFLGLLMASATLLVGGRTEQPVTGQTYFFYAPIFVPFFILGVPILDTAFAIIRRAGRFAVADTGHLHYRLMHLGHGHRRAVVILWVWTGLLSALVLYPTVRSEGNAFVPFGVAALGILLYTFFHPGIRRNGNGNGTGVGGGGMPAGEVSGSSASRADRRGTNGEVAGGNGHVVTAPRRDR